jgi:hypothetical protein
LFPRWVQARDKQRSDRESLKWGKSNSISKDISFVDLSFAVVCDRYTIDPFCDEVDPLVMKTHLSRTGP